MFRDKSYEFHGLWVDDKPIEGYIINKDNNSINKMDKPTLTKWDWSYNYGIDIKVRNLNYIK